MCLPRTPGIVFQGVSSSRLLPLNIILTLKTVGIASYNLVIQPLSFIAIALIWYNDTKDVDKNSWFSHTFFEIAVYSLISIVQLGPSPSSWPTTVVR